MGWDFFFFFSREEAGEEEVEVEKINLAGGSSSHWSFLHRFSFSVSSFQLTSSSTSLRTHAAASAGLAIVFEGERRMELSMTFERNLFLFLSLSLSFGSTRERKMKKGASTNSLASIEIRIEPQSPSLSSSKNPPPPPRMLSCTRNTAMISRPQFGPRATAAAKKACVVVAVVAASAAETASHARATADPGDLGPALCSRRGALLSAAAATPLASALLSSLAVVSPAPAFAAAASKKLPKLDAIKLYGSPEAAEAARAAAVAGVRKTLASVDPSSGGVLVRMAFHDAGTWDGAKRTGGANGSILLELERPENGGLKYGAALLSLARKAQGETLPKGAKQLSDADFIQVAGAVAVEAAGGPKIAVALGRPDARAKAGDPAGQLPSKDLDAKGLIGLFSSNGYSVSRGRILPPRPPFFWLLYQRERERSETGRRGGEKEEEKLAHFFDPSPPPPPTHPHKKKKT